MTAPDHTEPEGAQGSRAAGASADRPGDGPAGRLAHAPGLPGADGAARCGACRNCGGCGAAAGQRPETA
ncbi:hypothetical protein [Cribrihabitans neustonicus]|uniref:hypothetical protein n=1 Tax=Cribrihabitans neustonicus TaxID=1429085 RepID=UPI003B5A8E33